MRLALAGLFGIYIRKEEKIVNAFEKQTSKGPVMTLWVNEPSLATMVVTGKAGYGAVCIDLQHPLAGMSKEQVLGMIYASRASNPETAVLIRVPNPDPITISDLCQLGADGLVVPNVDTPDQAMAAWKATQFPPFGTFSVSAHQGRNNFGGEWNNPTLIPQLESALAEWSVRDMMAIEQIKWWFIGPADFARSCGKTNPWDPTIRVRITEMMSAGKEAGKKVGIMEGNVEKARVVLAQGYDMVALGTAFGAMVSAIEGKLKEATLPPA